MTNTLDPWSSSDIADYSKLFEEFGISPLDEILPEVPFPSTYMRRRTERLSQYADFPGRNAGKSGQKNTY